MTREWAGRREQLRLVLGRGELSLSGSAQALLFGTPPMRRLGHFLTDIGDRHGIPWLSYNPANFLWWHGAQLSSASSVARALDSAFPSATRYADIGAGSGVFGAALARRGRVVVACEHYRVGRWLARRQGLEVLPFDLTRDPPAHLRGVDVAFCFEVAEHLAAELGDRLVAFLSAVAPALVFTAAPPGQGGYGHVNEQPREYWLERFAAHGMSEDSASTRRFALEFSALRAVPWLAPNVIVLRRKDSACRPQ
jgi:hypothetical protein